MAALLLALGAAFCLLACDPVPRSAQEELFVAFLVAEGGDAAGQDAEYRRAAELVRRDVSRHGGIPTPRGRAALKVEVFTHGPGVEDALRAMRRALASGAAAVIGGTTSTQALPMAALAEERGIPFISPGATAPCLTAARQYVFGISSPDSSQGQALARLGRTRGATRAAVLYEQAKVSSSAQALEFQKEFSALGGHPPVLASFKGDRRDSEVQLRRLLRSRPQYLLLSVSHGKAAHLVRLSRAQGFPGDFAGLADWELAQDAEVMDMIGAHFLAPWCPGGDQTAGQQGFWERYTASFGRRPSAIAALVYDAFGLLFQAAGRALGLGPQTLAAALREVTEYSGVAGVVRFSGGMPARDAHVLQMTSQGILHLGIIQNAGEGRP
ncbi:MAG: ABC transporter substrate-binding protein [Proteobacteria bacterium]|nr:ABC transporter substrate-binding protein [Pseudomonadota bacterium]MBU1596288.1 ABC transporter substrate-binding protein [Pseudomonadota bacterium]